MTISAGTKLGPYEILSPIGKGGMGEVWKARDTKLGRDVALKILPAAFASDPDRMARFEREARVLASLDHPNIAAIYGLEESNGVRALVLALVDGSTLADRIAAGPIPLNEAIQIARQIAEAVEYAHERGVIHRDLKPTNIKITSGGMVKVLDFGLAKALDDELVTASPTNSPTLTMNATRAGVLLGTAAYMSPEQAKGKQADRRSDIWAFGTVLYEMLTGKPPFSGETVGDILASVIKEEPNLDAVPAELRRLVARCLNKDPRKRLQAIGEARISLEDPQTTIERQIEHTAQAPRLLWIIATGVLALALAFVSFIHFSETPVAVGRMQFSIALPENTAPGFFALSPNGRVLLMTTSRNGIGIRSIDSSEIRLLTGTLSARTPFWSPDNHTIGFFTDGKLKTVPVSGGPPQTLCNDTGLGGGGTWNHNGVIFATEAGALYRVSRQGGTCTQLTKQEPGVLRRFPVFLPDTDHFLYVLLSSDEARTGLYIASLRDPRGRRLLPDPSSAVFVPNSLGSRQGHLLFSREQRLMAQTFDAKSLQLFADPFVLAEHVSRMATPPQVAASASENGTVIYLANARPDELLVWYDRSGTELDRTASTGNEGGAVSLAPDGKRVVFLRTNAQSRQVLWMQDLERNTETPVNSPSIGVPGGAVWSPDGKQLAYAFVSEGSNAIFLKSTAGGQEKMLLHANNAMRPSDWSHDGSWLVYTDNDPRTGADIWMLPEPSKASGKPIPLIRTSFAESEGQISPDGKWLAYTSNKSGVDQVYLRPFHGGSPLSDVEWQVSTNQGREPRWRGDGKELFFIEPAFAATTWKLIAVSIEGENNPVGIPKTLFEFPSLTFTMQMNAFVYSPSADGQRFLINVQATKAQPTLNVLLNWTAELKK